MRRRELQWVLVAASLLVARPGAEQITTFRSRADAVQVDVLVRQGNKPVTALTAADFELRDSGVLQKIESVAVEDVPVSLMLVLDVSASVKGKPLEDLKTAARAAFEPLGPKDQAALLTFSERLALRAGWTTERTQLAAAIDAIEPGGGTALHDAISTALSMRQRATGRTLLLVFTDGIDTTSWLDPATIVEGVKRSDLVVYGVRASAASPHDAREAAEMMKARAAMRRYFAEEPSLFPGALLDTIAADSGGEMLDAAGGADLARVFARVVSDFKTRYLLTYAPQGVPASGWHPIEVKLRGVRGTVTARRGYSR